MQYVQLAAASMKSLNLLNTSHIRDNVVQPEAGSADLRNKLGEGPDVHSGSPLASDMVVLLWSSRLLYLDLSSKTYN